MPNYQKTIKSGNILEVERYFAPRAAGKHIPRSKNKNSTDERQKEKNFRESVTNLCRTINTNFTYKDAFVTFTYQGTQPTQEEAERIIRNWLRRQNYRRKKEKRRMLKWIYITECERCRMHHHMIITGMTFDEIAEAWTYGKMIMSPLGKNEEYKGLAHYLTKETTEPNKKRWHQSRNLSKPIVIRKELKSAAAAERKIPTPKGYKILNRYMDYYEDAGLFQSAKFVKMGPGLPYDLGMGQKERKLE